MLRRILNTTNDPTMTILRLVLGIVFFAHGAQNMLGWFGGGGFKNNMDFLTHQLGAPPPLAFLAIAAQFFGGLGLLVGLLSRFAAFGIGVDMIVAIVQVHLHEGFFMNWSGQRTGEGYEYHLLAIALALGVFIKGSGALSLDRLLTRAWVVSEPETRK